MNYLVFNQDHEMLDVLSFDSDEELNLFKIENPTHFITEEDDFTITEDDFFTDDEEDDLF